MEFSGRAADLALLDSRLRLVAGERSPSRGNAIIVTGRRRVGKSRLVQEFCDRSTLPYVIFQATRGRNPSSERADFVTAIAQSALPGGRLVAATRPVDWNHALRTLAAAVPAEAPSIVVIDEVPWIVAEDGEFEGALQTVWDRELSAKPVMLILVGSDLSVMEALTTYGRPFFGRSVKMTVRPLHLGDVAAMTGLGGADAMDAMLLTGGFPEIVQSWPAGASRAEFLRQSVENPLSPLLAAGELTVLGEFPGSSLTRAVLEAIGAGERTFTAIATHAGGGEPLASGSLVPILRTLMAKGVVAVDMPLSLKNDTRNKRYRIADTYLRCWLALISGTIPLIERGRPDLALARIERAWPAWRERAVEPIIRESLLRLLPDAGWPQTGAIGGWWNRQGNPEIDLVGTDRYPRPSQVHFAGSIKWYENKPFSARDYGVLADAVPVIPGAAAGTPLVAVSRSGFAPDLPLAATWDPEDLLRAWQ
ncbi:MAG: AAA family ATPase [Nocardiopsaceae bacterium]|nr:AAA family ATPase [Nocardiopsaceae bacterium]